MEQLLQISGNFHVFDRVVTFYVRCRYNLVAKKILFSQFLGSIVRARSLWELFTGIYERNDRAWYTQLFLVNIDQSTEDHNHGAQCVRQHMQKHCPHVHVRLFGLEKKLKLNQNQAGKMAYIKCDTWSVWAFFFHFFPPVE
ncbi:hypothetical protein BpHYR1_024151 [Brachionus plicatilis]|uniref:Uncharacterized protein n=1 Tax=Brachionus plicatilis TaxID=10195 RepID=A0A3M7R927_BRAPC|nr:hypothetical protein BpHYR1_024151 [Brachionus plicatilis]